MAAFRVPRRLDAVASEVVAHHTQAFECVPPRGQLVPCTVSVDVEDEGEAKVPGNRRLGEKRLRLELPAGPRTVETALANRHNAGVRREVGQLTNGPAGLPGMHADGASSHQRRTGSELNNGGRRFEIGRRCDHQHACSPRPLQQTLTGRGRKAIQVDVGVVPGIHARIVARPRRIRAMATLTLRGGHVWDGRAGTSSPSSVVVDGRFLAGADGGGKTLDISGCTVVPGLIEGHAHLCFDTTPAWRTTYENDTPAKMLLRMASYGRRMLRAGITTVRDLGSPTHLGIELREGIAEGLTEGPRLLVAGAPITTTGGHCWFMGGECDGELGIRRQVREHVKAGTDWIKVMATGGNMTPRTNTFAAQFTVDELRACVEEAHRLRRRVAAHAHGIEGIRVATEAGVDCIEHCSFTAPGGYEFDQPLVDRIAAKGILVSPTVSVGFRNWPDDGRRQQRGQVLKALLDSGCRVLMSTDCGIPGVPHESLAGGMQVLQELTGYAPLEILKLATSRSAELLGLEDRGVIEAGRLADLLVVEGDPTHDLSALERVRFVILDGEVAYAAR